MFDASLRSLMRFSSINLIVSDKIICKFIEAYFLKLQWWNLPLRNFSLSEFQEFFGLALTGWSGTLSVRFTIAIVFNPPNITSLIMTSHAFSPPSAWTFFYLLWKYPSHLLSDIMQYFPGPNGEMVGLVAFRFPTGLHKPCLHLKFLQGLLV